MRITSIQRYRYYILMSLGSAKTQYAVTSKSTYLRYYDIIYLSTLMYWWCTDVSVTQLYAGDKQDGIQFAWLSMSLRFLLMCIPHLYVQPSCWIAMLFVDVYLWVVSRNRCMMPFLYDVVVSLCALLEPNLRLQDNLHANLLGSNCLPNLDKPSGYWAKWFFFLGVKGTWKPSMTKSIWWFSLYGIESTVNMPSMFQTLTVWRFEQGLQSLASLAVQGSHWKSFGIPLVWMSWQHAFASCNVQSTKKQYIYRYTNYTSLRKCWFLRWRMWL